MAPTRSERVLDRDDAELATRAAWLYHVGGLLQAGVARELGISTFSAHRLIALATEQGFVRTLVDGPIAGCVSLEERVKANYGIGLCRVVPDHGIDPIRALGAAAAAFLDDVLKHGRHKVIGIGHGRTLAAINRNLPARQTVGVEFISLLGALPTRISSYPFEAIYHLTDRANALAYLIPAPLYADTAEDRAVFFRQSTTKTSFEKMPSASLCLIGIGTIDDKHLTDVKMGAIRASDLDVIKSNGGIAEILGCYYDVNGRKIDAALHERVIAMPPEQLAQRDSVAIAGGAEKVAAIAAILRSKLLNGLITTESTAESLLLLCKATHSKPKRGRRNAR